MAPEAAPPGQREVPWPSFASPIVASAALAVWGILFGPLSLFSPTGVYEQGVFVVFMAVDLGLTAAAIGLAVWGLRMSRRDPRRFAGQGSANAGLVIASTSFALWAFLLGWYILL